MKVANVAGSPIRFLLLPTLPSLQQALAPVAAERAAAQLGAHERVREASRTKGRVTIQPVLPVDILDVYVVLPMPGAGGPSWTGTNS